MFRQGSVEISEDLSSIRDSLLKKDGIVSTDKQDLFREQLQRTYQQDGVENPFVEASDAADEAAAANAVDADSGTRINWTDEMKTVFPDTEGKLSRNDPIIHDD